MQRLFIILVHYVEERRGAILHVHILCVQTLLSPYGMHGKYKPTKCKTCKTIN